MPIHDYTPSEALELLMRKLQEKDARIAQNIQSIIDSGQDIQEEQTSNRRGKKKRAYRRTVPFTTEEALEVALKALNSYFVEIPLFINSATENFKESSITVSSQPEESSTRSNSVNERSRITLAGVQEKKRIEFELQTETQISRNEQETLPISSFEEEQIDRQRSNLKRIQFLLNFAED